MRIIIILLMVLAVSACANTVRGVGKDLRETGDAISDQF